MCFKSTLLFFFLFLQSYYRLNWICPRTPALARTCVLKSFCFPIMINMGSMPPGSNLTRVLEHLRGKEREAPATSRNRKGVCDGDVCSRLGRTVLLTHQKLFWGVLPLGASWPWMLVFSGESKRCIPWVCDVQRIKGTHLTCAQGTRWVAVCLPRRGLLQVFVCLGVT
jgi:hypothetical protein